MKAKGWSLFWRPTKKRWVLNYGVAPQRKQRMLPPEVHTKSQATTWARTFLEQLDLENVIPIQRRRRNDGPTVSDLAERWEKLRRSDKRLAEATVRDSLRNVTNHVIPAFGPVYAALMEPPTIRKWLRDLSESHAPHTVRNILSSFATMFDDAMAEGWVNLPANPIRHPAVQKERPKAQKLAGHNVVIHLSLGAAQALLDHLELGLFWRARYAVALTSSLRDGEISGLTWADVSLKERVIHVRQSFSTSRTLGRLKTMDSRRVVPMHQCAHDALREWLDTAWARWTARALTPRSPVFPSQRGEHVRLLSARYLRAHLGAVGFPTKYEGHPVDFHATRRSFCTWLADAGVSEQVIGRLMGHKGRTTTEVNYTSRSMQQLREAVANIPLRWPALAATAAHSAVNAAALGSKEIQIPQSKLGGEDGIRTRV